MILPEFKDKKIGYLNLNLEAKVWCEANSIIPTKENNPLLDPQKCQEFVDAVHKKYELDFSYGGWMEDRSYLWQGGYLEETNNFIHLGIDINAPFGTKVATCFDAEVTKIDNDYPTEGGWGPRIILKHLEKDVYIIYAHLDEKILVKKDQIIKKGDIIATLGKAPQNGNWFPHLHVQVVSKEHYSTLKTEQDWDRFDGYGNDQESDAKKFYDPLNYITLN